ncbi:ribonuclease [Altererythrobacter arenosus]|uniref:Ribonuclease n=1 Tax=Altererythrobacter arenosus TaxID=3032592 RepID=A0ABY8FU79_9SPHN|nr:ribonuclease [Altererythrobacter sp. CAU 1644]WFL77645.1 ribonuclease [Altererythrobacter sp. CAU 1644]
MAESLVERGIGEDRAILVEGDKVLATRMRWPGEPSAGQRVKARLTHRSKGSNRAIGLTESGLEILLDRVPVSASEGSQVDVMLTRAPIAERGRLKRAQGRIAAGDAETGERDVFAEAREVRRFPAGLWEEVWDAASSGEVAFAGGSLLLSVTPAMTLIDIDGDIAPRELALAAIPALAASLRQFDLGGSIGIDFPTIEAKAERKAIDAALDSALADWPHERTAMNGFGFVQIVARLEGPSLLHRFATSRVGTCARMALRRAETVAEPGALLLTVHPAVKAKLKPEWIEELARRTGREVRIEADPGLALEAGFAQAVPL